MIALASTAPCLAQSGSIRGIVHDMDFEVPLPAARVEVLDLEGRPSTETTEQGNYVIENLPPGRYTVRFSKDGYTSRVEDDVVVSAGRLTELNAWLTGSFEEMDEFIVQDVLQLGGGSEAALLELRFEDPSFLDSVSAELMSAAGASDAAGALRLVAGASVQDGKFAVIRGLPDRYVSSQMNGVRLPTADEDKRAVELDQFPSAVIDSIQVSKTFTPDQQGDASGGAVDVRLEGIPDEPVFKLEAQLGTNSQVSNRDDFLSYSDGGFDFWGKPGGHQIQPLNTNWTGAVGTDEVDAPTDFKLSLEAGDRWELDNGLLVGGFANFFYERDSSFYDDGIDDSYWVEPPAGTGLVPETKQGTSTDNDFKTALFDVTKATQSVQWGGLGTFGVQGERNSLALTYLFTRIAEDTATLAEDTRGKEYFFPGYDPDDPGDPSDPNNGNSPDNVTKAPWVRTQTLRYAERTTETLQLHGEHEGAGELGRFLGLDFDALELDWIAAASSASIDEPDKRQFGVIWIPPTLKTIFPGFPPQLQQPFYDAFKPSQNVNLGNLQRTFKTIDEDSRQLSADLTLPFVTGAADDGYLKFGAFRDRVERKYDQDTFSNFGDNSTYQATWDQKWSDVFPSQGTHPIDDGPPFIDVDYDGELGIDALYGMIDYPLTSKLSLITGARFERTNIAVVNFPETGALWYPEGASAGQSLDPGEGNVSIDENDVLPSVALTWEPTETWMFRASYSRTLARQTFKELTPILQQEFLGGPVFIGNPNLEMSSLDNFDLRADWQPAEGSLISASVFYKDVEDPIEYVKRITTLSFTTAENYPEGELAGVELELRQDLGRYASSLTGLAAGMNATFIDSEVTLHPDDAMEFEAVNIQAPMPTRDMTNAPEHLYNLYLTYDFEPWDTRFGLFYTVKGDTLVEGAGVSVNNFVPSVYETETDSLNFSMTTRISRNLELKLQAKNLTDPLIEEVYRSPYTGPDVVKTAHRKGRELSFGITLSL